MAIGINKDQPLVSICVITYNSSPYVVETLESIKGQTYQNIELVISDDFSTDNTVQICRKWIDKNSKRFVRCLINEANKNGGVSANCNKGLKMCKGKWLKLIAGDDILLPECISFNLNFVKENPEAEFIGSLHIPFYMVDGHIVENINKDDIYRRNILNKISTYDIKKQYSEILRKDSIYTTTLFYSRHLFEEIKFNENYRTMEDYPFKLDVLKKGFRYYHFDKVTVRYRNHYDSISGLKKGKLFTKQYETNHKFDLDYRYNELGWKYRFLLSYNYAVKCVFDKIGLNRNNLFCFVLYKIFTGGIGHSIKRMYQYTLVKFGKSGTEADYYFKFREFNKN